MALKLGGEGLNEKSEAYRQVFNVVRYLRATDWARKSQKMTERMTEMAGEIIMLAQMEMKPRILPDDGNWKGVEMAAFAGATNEVWSQFGIGLVDKEDHCWFWALAMPHLLVTSWRGMQVLDQLERIQNGTIHHAYYIGKRREESDLERAIYGLKEQMPEIAKLRDELLGMKIPDEELDRMLQICNSSNNSIDVATFGQVGFPVILLKDGRELMLQNAHYHDDQMWVGVCPVKSDDELTEWKLDDLAAMEPQMIGITYGKYDKPSPEEAERGYALVTRNGLPGWVSQLLQKLKK